MKQPRTKDEEMEDLLLQEARVQHQKIRAQTLSRRPTDKYDPLKKEATPIKEEDIEEEFDDGMSGSQSKTTGGGAFGIEEAKNYDSALSQSKSRDLSKSRELSQSRDHPRSPTKTETSKMSDSLAGGVQGSLNVFKQSLSNSNSKVDAAGATNNKSHEEIPVEVVESDEEYRDEDFDDSQGSEALAKVSVSQSGRLPPLSGSYPHGVTDKTLTATFLKSSKEPKNAHSPAGAKEATERGSPTVKNIAHGEQRPESSSASGRLKENSSRGKLQGLGPGTFGNVDDSAPSIDFDLSESKFTGLDQALPSPQESDAKRTTSGPVAFGANASGANQAAGSRHRDQQARTLLNKHGAAGGGFDESALSMDKDDFELSESNFSMSLASNANKKVGGGALVSHAPFTGAALRERAATAVQPRAAPRLEVALEKQGKSGPPDNADEDEDDNYESDFD